MAKPTIRTPKRESSFLDGLRDGQSVTAACIDSGISRSTAYEWRDADEDFRKRWDEAVEEGTDRLEDEAQRRARDGVSEPVFYKGDIVGHVQRHSDTLMIFLLKARRPEKFKGRVATELTGKDGGPIEHEVKVQEDAERFTRAITGLVARKGTTEGT
jgi:hypothetical protein